MIPAVLFVLAVERSFAARGGCFGDWRWLSEHRMWGQQLWGQVGSLVSLELAGKGRSVEFETAAFEESMPEPLSPRKGKVSPLLGVQHQSMW